MQLEHHTLRSAYGQLDSLGTIFAIVRIPHIVEGLDESDNDEASLY